MVITIIEHLLRAVSYTVLLCTMLCLILKTDLWGRFYYPHFVSEGLWCREAGHGGLWAQNLLTAQQRLKPRRVCLQGLCSWSPCLASCSADHGLGKLKHSFYPTHLVPGESRNSPLLVQERSTFVSTTPSLLKVIPKVCKIITQHARGSQALVVVHTPRLMGQCGWGLGW